MNFKEISRNPKPKFYAIHVRIEHLFIISSICCSSITGGICRSSGIFLFDTVNKSVNRRKTSFAISQDYHHQHQVCCDQRVAKFRSIASQNTFSQTFQTNQNDNDNDNPSIHLPVTIQPSI